MNSTVQEKNSVFGQKEKMKKFPSNTSVEILMCQVLNQKRGLRVPDKMRLEFSQMVENDCLPDEDEEMRQTDVWDKFQSEYFNKKAPCELVYCKVSGDTYFEDKSIVEGVLKYRDRVLPVKGSGNGPINAFVNGMRKAAELDFDLVSFDGHAVQSGSHADIAAYVSIRNGKEGVTWGAGVDSDMNLAAIKAIVSAVNRL